MRHSNELRFVDYCLSHFRQQAIALTTPDPTSIGFMATDFVKSQSKYSALAELHLIMSSNLNIIHLFKLDVQTQLLPFSLSVLIYCGLWPKYQISRRTPTRK